MLDCPYCGAGADDEARYCDRCGERLIFGSAARDGPLRRSSIQYLQGVRHGARPLDPETTYHEQLQADLRAAVSDLSYLAGVEELDLAAVVGVDASSLRRLDLDRSPDADMDADTRRALGVAAFVALLSDAYDGPTLDELRVAVSGGDD